MSVTIASARPPVAASAGTDAAWLERLKGEPRRPGEASFYFFESHFARPAVKVLPGEYAVHAQDVLITTTLGSCIAACLWDRERRVGGMNHFLLPDGSSGPGELGGRYGAFAMDQLIGQLVRMGANRSSMEAKVFGGGAVIAGMTTVAVGERNTQFVVDYLATERIPIVARDVLDIYPRKVCFLPASGKAMVKRLAPATAGNAIAEDRQALVQAQARAPAAGGSVDLF